jgi:hypothetical protein
MIPLMMPTKGTFYNLSYCLINSFSGITCTVRMIPALAILILIIKNLSGIKVF